MSRAGELTDRIDIETPPISVGTRGEKTGDWTALHSNVPASVKELAGKELELSRQYLATATHQVSIRWHTGLTEAHRITWGDRTLGIGHIRNPDNRRNWQVLTCEEKKQ